jgi:methylglutamate dehydrogenase subunit D
MTGRPFAPNLVPRSAFAGFTQALPTGQASLFVTDRDGLGIATVLVRKDATAALEARVQEVVGLALPRGPRRVAAGDIAFIGIGPGAWLVTGEGGGNAVAPWLAERLAGLASVSDQTDGQAVLQLGGDKVRDVLRKLVPVDVHPRVFDVGAAAATVAAHMPVTMWRREDSREAAPLFEISVPRSMAQSFISALEASAEYGICWTGKQHRQD